MENQTPISDKNIGAAEDFSLFFASLELEGDGVSEIEKLKKIKNQKDAAQETSDKRLRWPEIPDSKSSNIWGERFFFTDVPSKGEDSASKPGQFDYFRSENFEVGSSSQQPNMDSFGSYPSMCVCGACSERIPMFYEDSSFRPTNNYENDDFEQEANKGLFYDNDRVNNYEQEIDNFPEVPKSLIEVLRGRNPQEIEAVRLSCSDSYLSMMVDRHWCVVFRNLLDACMDDKQLNSIAKQVLLQKHYFIDAAFSQIGSSSIMKLIERLKLSNHAYKVTRLLSTRFLEMMTDYVAKDVIQHCFIYFGDEPNKILYNKAMHYLLEVATHKVGCRALNETIDIIGAREQCSKLLNIVADHSAYLSDDQYGNYVVQQVLLLRRRDICGKIVLSLRGKFVELATKIGGSNVVEKCMKCSDFGLVNVVGEILLDPESAVLLAHDHFGNYVIQTALRKTRECRLDGLYNSLAGNLLPFFDMLNTTPGGKNVMNLLRHDGRVKRRTSVCGKHSKMRWR